MAVPPIPATPLIGCASEVSLACQLLQCEGVRLVTLSGPGGIGKTRLALSSVATAVADFMASHPFED
jgi:predicted ribonuclease YlaK